MSEDIKKIVQKKYAEILDKNKVLGCGCGCGDENDFIGILLIKIIM